MPQFSIIHANDIALINHGQGTILDVRTEMEHAEKHLGSRHLHVPLDQLDPVEFMSRHGLSKDSSICILCRSGKRATQAAELFCAAGFTNIKVINGGIVACEDCGQDIQGHCKRTSSPCQVKGPISLERQVRIAAGLLIAIGAVLGLAVTPLFTLIPLLVGCGLIFAGVTDRCGLALVLTRAPWNKIKTTTATTQV